MEGSKKGTSKDTMSNLEKLQADFAVYLRHKYFSGKDIEGEEIFEEIAKIGGMTIKGSRFPPTSSYEDPVAYRNGFTASCVEVEKNLLADLVDEENRIPRLEYPVKPARNQVEPLGVQDTSDDSSDSLQEISADAWNEVQSAIKQAKSGVGPSQKRP
ncbi:uncharacterized protein LOC112520300 isoform X6 [Cynara cardunculus var. scolymus]|uniref:Uncharacterized protein n=2 Tax=Cynara cardunculus var. scolymus TaxID=59895 RepID=A0A103Y0T9_CYNCS|nr:uncharacterized protein LOC112520300 isoform X6 [Cynara cardunculus var. scolymus]XP_024984394.1 uncharacterized protein LOC112520300 isoform X6 [Cynara cardunculus var. scolymus]XP_024984395.1 uncharacterized protein LOC112520300 isoform X6 [Cynara cardunculus var. scolymus]XP_024984396.1 uncharacterized protein LOC112520300 isoform X6 [Cynara cardunculus var. scolymus]KVI00427.1 hypothetical protein Ccrd_021402 [Cynara cardunculus var. scolymus]